MLATILTAAAVAAPFGDAPPSTVQSDRAECTRPAGAPGELFTVERTGVRLLTASRGGIAPGALVELESGCPVVATTASGAGVMACCVDRGGVPIATTRDPGGPWSQPVELADDSTQVVGITAAVSERGDTVVAWIERSGRNRVQVSMVRRAPGGTFGAPEVLDGPYSGTSGTIASGIGGDGDVAVMWTRPNAQPRNTVDVKVATAAGPATTLARLNRRGAASLAVAADGHALVAFSDGASVQVAERAPGTTFGAPTVIADAHDPVAVKTRAVLGSNGRAVIAWTGIALGGVHVISRPAGGAFSAPVTLAAGNRRMLDDMFLNDLFGGISGGPGHWEFGGADIATALGPDGRATLTWPRADKVNLATFGTAGERPEVRSIGGAPWPMGNPIPLFLADGAPALAWIDRYERGRLRLRLAADGATHEEPALPRLRVRAPAERTLRGERAALRIPVECDRPCELVAEASGIVEGWADLDLDKAGTGTLSMRPLFDDVDRNREGRVRVRVSARAIGGTRQEQRTISFRIARTGLHHEPPTRVTNLRVTRDGNAIRVRFRMSQPQEDVTFPAVGTATRSRFEEPLVEGWTGTSRDHRSFSLTLRPAAGVRYVTLYAFGATRERIVTPVR
ncbi:hypothetical protein [Solirubrobacter soli]|uniref:hypothetical protein n=1 Tax=Solirubrobacter soli TaxID=363832 RepID=UPI00041522EE|nr:hypothetical protein [Solirubrobacter soli]